MVVVGHAGKLPGRVRCSYMNFLLSWGAGMSGWALSIPYSIFGKVGLAGHFLEHPLGVTACSSGADPAFWIGGLGSGGQHFKKIVC